MQINSAWGQWSKEVEKTCREIQGLCSPLISPLYFCIVAKAFWTHSTVGRNNNTTVECFIYRLSKRQNKGGKNWNLYDERSPNKQTQKRKRKKKKRVTHFISSSYVFSSSHLPTLPPAENGAVGKIFFRAGGNTLWQCDLTHTSRTLAAANCFFLWIACGNMNKGHAWVSSDHWVCPCLAVTFTTLYRRWPLKALLLYLCVPMFACTPVQYSQFLFKATQRLKNVFNPSHRHDLKHKPSNLKICHRRWLMFVSNSGAHEMTVAQIKHENDKIQRMFTESTNIQSPERATEAES